VKRFTLAEAPAHFEDLVATPGASWLHAHPTGRPHPYWLEVREEVGAAFNSLCAYSVMYLPNGTVDHAVSCDEDRSRTYDWSNFRYSAGWFNSSKQALRSAEVLDPFDVHDPWFEILLPSLQLVATDAVPPDLRDRAQTMLNRLHLGHDVRVLKQRRQWYQMYRDGRLTLDGLDMMAPLIAAAVRKAGDSAN